MKKRQYFAAIDLGATSGRIMLAGDNGDVEEIFRFPTPVLQVESGLFWDFEQLFAGVIAGLQKLTDVAEEIVSVSCDSWAQDFGMLDEDGHLVHAPFSYRDGRCAISSAARLSDIEENFPQYRKRTVKILHIADLVHFFLCGEARSNYSLAAISGLPLEHPLLAPLADCEIIGTVRHDALKALHGIPVISGAGHDTAAAFVCGNTQKNEVLISIGTWQMTAARQECVPAASGTRLLPLPGKEAARTTGSLGLGPYQHCVRLWKQKGIFPGYDVLEAQAECSGEQGFLLPDRPELLSPENIEDAIFSLTGKHLSPPEITALLLRGTARRIAESVNSFGVPFAKAVLVGGGTRSRYLRSLLNAQLPCPAAAGNAEASAAGNILIQKRVMAR